MTGVHSDSSSPAVNEAALRKAALQKLRARSERVMDANALFSARLSPDLADILYLPYTVTPRYPNWSGITLVPVFGGLRDSGALSVDRQSTPGEPDAKAGTLGVEVVSPERKILCHAITHLNRLESYQPVFLPFAVIPDSRSKTYEVRVYVRDVRSSISILESRFLSPAAGLRRWRARPLCKLSFDHPEPALFGELDVVDGERIAPVIRSSRQLPLELASSVGSQSLEDHYWCSGWQTANVQLLADLQPDDSILDVGCGVGRLAQGFHGWYGGRYVGVDVMPQAIEYCKRAFPRFEFYHLDVKSPYYNPEGKVEPDEMVLPIEDQAFDLAVLYSVYTHLLPATFLRMTDEVCRALRPGGRCLATFFILDGQTEKASMSFSFPWAENCRVESRDAPESAVAYTREFILREFARRGLRVKTSLQGSWTGQPGITVQDQLLLVKD